MLRHDERDCLYRRTIERPHQPNVNPFISPSPEVNTHPLHSPGCSLRRY